MTSAAPAEWAAAAELLRGAGTVALACHVGPDGDALGSMLGLGAALRARGTEVVASWGGEPFEVPAAYSFLPALDLLVPAAAFPAAPELMVTFDSGSADRLGSLEDRLNAARAVLVIDHHATNTRYGTLNLVDPSAAATASMVARLLDMLDLPITAEVAAPLYTGLVTDTGSFKYAATTPEVHQLAARLLATGIRHDLISRAIWDNQPFAYIQLLGAAAARAVLERAAVGGAGLVWTTVTSRDFAAAGLGMADVEGVIDVVRAAEEAEVAAVLKEEPDGSSWRLSMRSKGAVDVGAICAALGGGGHRFAAGLTWTGRPEALLEVLRPALAAAPRLSA
ncbi:MAG: bifunctional oligoribonuclease/PAP phosphatase NrnA [Actinomycetota bacterium]|nr:bifunctional oligoribonuclease/PAP phosphatase NrnA [Actinomycetota bacterium]